MQIDTHQPLELKLNGSLDISRCAWLREELGKALQQTDQLVLDLSGTTGIDVACLQILCAAQRSAERSDKRLGFATALPAPLEKTLTDVGFFLEADRRAGAEPGQVWLTNRPKDCSAPVD